MNDLERIILLEECEEEAREEREERERNKAFIMSYANRIKPFFVEFQFMEESLIGMRKKAHGMINGSLIKSFQPIDPKKPDKGTQINYVFGEFQFVAESVEEVRRRMNAVIGETYS